jgi:hypothetical protein
MPETVEQSYENHRRYDLPYHGFVLGVIAVSALLALWQLVKGRRALDFWYLLQCGAAFVLFLRTRSYALRVQDRVIRLEERLRLERLLAEPLRARIPELTGRQLVALRFASDAELPALVEKTLVEALTEDQIKRQIASWRPDDLRI